MFITQRPQRGWERRDFLESLEAGAAGAASLRWPLATQLSTKVGKNHQNQANTFPHTAGNGRKSAEKHLDFAPIYRLILVRTGKEEGYALDFHSPRLLFEPHCTGRATLQMMAVYFMLRKEVLRSKPADSAFSASVRLSITSLSFKEEM